MNNAQFRELLSSGQADTSSPGEAAAQDGTGSGKKRSFSAMAPRTVRSTPASSDFARQFRERNAGMQPTKKFKSTAAPKGAKYGAGYVDRAKARAEAENAGDDKAERIKALEEQMKLQQISPETFEALRDKITGGDVSATHLVKGLDRRLLERVRRGEDVLGLGDGGDGTVQTPATADVDEELEKLAEKEVESVKHDPKDKKGSLAAPQTLGAGKKTRDEIMAELKAQRKAAQEAKTAASLQLGDRFRRIDRKQKPKVEIDAKGREVVTIVGPDGKVKKKVRKVNGVADGTTSLAMPDSSKPVLGADVDIPAVAKPVTGEDSDDDIFTGVGTEYNPLAGEEDDDDSDDTSDNTHPPAGVDRHQAPTELEHVSSSDRESPGSETTEHEDHKFGVGVEMAGAQIRRNYFNERPSETSDDQKPDHRSAIEEVLKKASKMNPLDSYASAATPNPEEKARLEKRAKMLANRDRDMDDMDIGFGGSRIDDDEGAEDERVRLSEWKGKADGDGWGEDEEKGHGGKKKRKPKKRKGDANNMGDIMRVIEGRKSKNE